MKKEWREWEERVDTENNVKRTSNSGWVLKSHSSTNKKQHFNAHQSLVTDEHM